MVDHSVDREIRKAADLGLPNKLTRSDIETAIARLIELLDTADGDVDLEVDDCDLEDDEDDDTSADEPSLGSVDGEDNQSCWGEGSASDAEFDDSDDELTNDEEPWLGAPETTGDQTSWCRGASTDCEETGTIEDSWMPGRFYRLRSEPELLRQIEADALALAGRLRRRRPAKPRRRVDPDWVSTLRRCR